MCPKMSFLLIIQKRNENDSGSFEWTIALRSLKIEMFLVESRAYFTVSCEIVLNFFPIFFCDAPKIEKYEFFVIFYELKPIKNTNRLA